MVDSSQESLKVLSEDLDSIHFHELNEVRNRDTILSQRNLAECIGLDEVGSLEEHFLDLVSLLEEPGLVLQMLGNGLLGLILQRLVQVKAICLASKVADVSEGAIGRWQEDLAEVVEVEVAIHVGIELLDNQLCVPEGKFKEVLLQELQDLLGVNLAVVVLVESSKGLARLEINTHRNRLAL